MWVVSLFSFVMLAGYLVASARRYGVPDMVSDTFYQWKGRGWLFTLAMAWTDIPMMVCMLDSERGMQPLAFLGCLGLLFVGFSPNYFDKDEYVIHKGGAAAAAVGCVGWCVTVNPAPTVAVAVLYALRVLAERPHPWYWAEVAAFADVFLTYWWMFL